MVATGAAVSVVPWNEVGALLPNGSVAWTVNVWLPSATVGPASGDVHALSAAASKPHANVAVPSVDENVKSGVASFVGSAGCVSIDTGGGVASTVKLRDAGDGSTTPLTSLARTWKLWPPSAGGNACRVVQSA